MAIHGFISCIIPVHNGAAFIEEALNSIRAQDVDGLDVIVIDDGSTDNSADIARSMPGVRVFRQDKAGVAAARNAGLAQAKGAFIAFLDADDLWLPGKLAAQMALLEQNPGADLCLTWMRNVTAAGLEGAIDDKPRIGRMMQCLLARRSAFDRIGGFDTGTVTRADQDWFMRAHDAGLETVIVPDIYMLRRVHGANHSLATGSRVADDFITIAKRRLDRRRAEGAPVEPFKSWSA